MKIRTKEEFFNKLSDDISWRKKEMSFYKSRIDTANTKYLNSEVVKWRQADPPNGALCDPLNGAS